MSCIMIIMIDQVANTLSHISPDVDGFSQTHRQRYEHMKNYVDNSPKVNKNKPMLYYAAGEDILTFLGSGASCAYYIDTAYNNSTGGILNSIRQFDKDAKFIEYPVDSLQKKRERIVGEIEFTINGKSKKIYLDSHSIVNGYVPPILTETGCSVLAIIGAAPNIKSVIPHIKADCYVNSLITPTAFGYSDHTTICDGVSNPLTISWRYDDQGLSSFEGEELLSDQNMYCTLLIRGLRGDRDAYFEALDYAQLFVEGDRETVGSITDDCDYFLRRLPTFEGLSVNIIKKAKANLIHTFTNNLRMLTDLDSIRIRDVILTKLRE